MHDTHTSTTDPIAWHLLKDDRAAKDIVTTTSDTDERDLFSRIRCPLCRWQPTASSRWRCERRFTPEPPFDSCGTVWNTFSTGGRCPGCSHQWRWTTCLRCTMASLHADWYEQRDQT